jgi:predicted outer membrane repeat protein
MGGGIFFQAGGTLTVSGSTLTGNSAKQAHGGGIFSGDTLTVSGCTQSGNSATTAGAGFYIGRIVTVENSSSITGDTAPVGAGADVYNQGALHLDSTSTIGILDGNPASGFSRGIEQQVLRFQLI